MLQEAFKFLFDAGRDSAPAVVKVPGEPDHVYYLRKPDGALERTEAAQPPDRHSAMSLQAIVALAEHAVEHDMAAEAWHATDKVELRYNARDRVTLPLILSDQVKQLIEWRDQKRALTQAELIRVLRTTFRDSLAQVGTLLEVLKKVKFNTSSAISGEVGHGRASLGKEIMGEVTGTGLIPEYVAFNLPVFANACFRPIRAQVECALDPNAADGTFRVIPLPGQIEAAIDAGNAGIGALLADQLPNDVPVYYGTA